MLPEESKILEMKYCGKRFSQMSPKQVLVSAKEILLRVHVITGWVMPSNELMAILVDEFANKLIEDYKNVNAAEFNYAFRSESHNVKEWGKSLNIALIDEVMIPYLKKRNEVSRIEESKNQNKKQIEYKPDLEQIERDYQEFLKTDVAKKFNLKP